MSIPKGEAEGYIMNYLAIQDSLRASNGLEQVQNQDAKTYYDTNYNSFVFEKYRIDALFTDHPDADALRIYFAAHPGGEPTLVLIVAQLNVNYTKVMNKSASNAQEQWPGGKGSRPGGGGITAFDLGDDSIY